MKRYWKGHELKAYAFGRPIEDLPIHAVGWLARFPEAHDAAVDEMSRRDSIVDESELLKLAAVEWEAQ